MARGARACRPLAHSGRGEQRLGRNGPSLPPKTLELPVKPPPPPSRPDGHGREATLHLLLPRRGVAFSQAHLLSSNCFAQSLRPAWGLNSDPEARSAHSPGRAAGAPGPAGSGLPPGTGALGSSSDLRAPAPARGRTVGAV